MSPAFMPTSLLYTLRRTHTHVHTQRRSTGAHTRHNRLTMVSHTHTCTQMFMHMCTQALTHTHSQGPEASELTWIPGAGPGLCPSDSGSISFLPLFPPSLPQMFAGSPARWPDVLSDPGCLRDPETEVVARLPSDVSMTPHPPQAGGSQALERDPVVSHRAGAALQEVRF